MAIQTFENLRTRSEEIRTELVDEANTTERVGSFLTDTIDTLESKIITWVSVPLSPTSAGTIGQKAVDDNFIYEVIGLNLWARYPRDTSSWSNS